MWQHIGVYLRSQKGVNPIKLVALTGHHTPTQPSSRGILWITMRFSVDRRLLFWESAVRWDATKLHQQTQGVSRHLLCSSITHSVKVPVWKFSFASRPVSLSSWTSYHIWMQTQQLRCSSRWWCRNASLLLLQRTVMVDAYRVTHYSITAPTGSDQWSWS
jgi:hypothetical protein